MKNKTTRILKVINRFGLHARPAAMLVETASRFDCEVTLSKDGVSANGKSIMSVMLLAAESGSEVELAAEGPQADGAIEAIDALFQARFNEDEG
ncbi:MAG: HPr family phosphocarrier protein [Fibrobacterota bacterium]|nr:HPr family phosphocarrier protein [Fibrobacterota bacterium]QQS03723.1 MAG: HPr family phosphocarrier protein [Fibrobacterota bacterium]